MVVRSMQNFAVEQLYRSQAGEVVFLCQHPAVITLGKRVDPGEVTEQLPQWRKRGIDVIQTDRGGEMTYHGPGQLVIYPVLKLRKHGLGVRKFVEQILELIAEQLDLSEATIDLDAPGIWVGDSPRRKIASVGLRIQAGITNHGFSVNLAGDTSVFKEFPVCGMAGTVVTSHLLERPEQVCSPEEFSWKIVDGLRAAYC